jgi:hypothetical protein
MENEEMNEKMLLIYNNLTNEERQNLFDIMLNRRWQDMGGSVSNDFIIETISKVDIVNDILSNNIENIIDWVEDTDVSENMYIFLGMNERLSEIDIERNGLYWLNDTKSRLDLFWEHMELEGENNENFIMGYNDENMRVWDYVEFYVDRTVSFLESLVVSEEYISWSRDMKLELLGI